MQLHIYIILKIEKDYHLIVLKITFNVITDWPLLMLEYFMTSRKLDYVAFL